MKTTLLSLKAFFTICLLCLVGGVNVMAQDTETVDFTKQGYTQDQNITEYQGKDFKIAFSNGTNTTHPRFYSGDLRVYKNNTITFSSTKKIKEIVFTYGSKKANQNNSYKLSEGSYKGSTFTWTSNSESGSSGVTFTPTATFNILSAKVIFVGGTTTPETETPAPTITPASKNFSESFVATISCTDAAAKIYYTLDGKTPDATNTLYTTGVTIPEVTTTLKAVAIKDGKTSKVAEAVYTYEPPTYTYTIWSEDWDKFTEGTAPTEGTNATYLCNPSSSSGTRVLTNITSGAGGTGNELIIKKNSEEGSLTINVTSLKGYSGTLYFSFLTNKELFKVESATSGVNIGTPTKEGNKKYTYAITVPEGTEGLNLKITNTAERDNMRVDNLSLSAKFPILGTDKFTITSAQYGTYYTEDAFVMPEGVTGYTITSEDGKTLKFNKTYAAGAVVPAKTALLLKADEKLAANKDFTYTIVNSDAVAPTNNLLHGSVAEAMTNVEGAKAYYKLANPTEGLGFYYGAENGGAFKNGAHKAYLAVKTETLSQMRGFSFDSMTTGINHVVANAEHAKSTVIYDLNGRRVNSLNAAAKGVYIVNGKKIIVK